MGTMLGILAVMLLVICTVLLLIGFVGLLFNIAECLPAKWRALKRAWAVKDDRR